MSESQQSYRQIIKTTTMFSGVQIFGILISIARAKFAAIFIGPLGLGIVGVLNSTLDLIIGITKLGLDVSSVKEISVTSSQGSFKKTSRTINVLKRLTWITGLFGALITIILSPWLSEIAFGDKEYTSSFIFISIAVFFNQLTIGNLAILQGLRKLNKLAKATLLASFFSLIVIIPLYYYFRIKGIVPVIILTSMFTFFLSWVFSRQYNEKSSKIKISEVFAEGKEMIRLGFVLSLGALATLLVTFIMQIFISNYGGINQVGFYNAAFIIINAYVGVIFNAMGKDYFPRLSAIIEEKHTVISVVNQQAYVSILLLTPIIVLFLAFSSLIVRILFSNDFLPIIGLLTYGMLASLFKAVSWTMGFILIAKGDSKLFVQTEIVFNSMLLLMSVLGYVYGGLTGVGICYLLYYVIYLIGIKLITAYKYSFKFKTDFYKIFVACVLFCISAYVATYLNNLYVKYGLFTLLIFTSSIFSIIRLNEKINFKDILLTKFSKNKD